MEATLLLVIKPGRHVASFLLHFILHKSPQNRGEGGHLPSLRGRVASFQKSVRVERQWGAFFGKHSLLEPLKSFLCGSFFPFPSFFYVSVAAVSLGLKVGGITRTTGSSQFRKSFSSPHAIPGSLNQGVSSKSQRLGASRGGRGPELVLRGVKGVTCPSLNDTTWQAYWNTKILRLKVSNTLGVGGNVKANPHKQQLIFTLRTFP